MPNACVDCSISPRPNEAVPCFSESFPLTTTTGGRFTVTLRLCFTCGARFSDRAQLRSYLATKLPAYAALGSVVAA